MGLIFSQSSFCVVRFSLRGGAFNVHLTIKGTLATLKVACGHLSWPLLLVGVPNRARHAPIQLPTIIKVRLLGTHGHTPTIRVGGPSRGRSPVSPGTGTLPRPGPSPICPESGTLPRPRPRFAGDGDAPPSPIPIGGSAPWTRSSRHTN